MSEFKPVRFVDVALEGRFWRERLEKFINIKIKIKKLNILNKLII